MNPSLKQQALFIADVHLQPDETHPINRAFHAFLNQETEQADSLYILGDLFEMWVGDDIGLKTYTSTISHLRRLTDQGLKIYLLFGNRDFLMRKTFWQATGIIPIREPKLLSFDDLDILVMHGDALCTDDKQYQKMRRLLRNPIVTWLFLKLPQKKRIQIGENMRAKSIKYSANKAQNIMDVNPQAVQALFEKWPNCQHLIHGHTHRPAKHEFVHNNQTLTRWVLGDWRPECQYISLNEKSDITLLPYSAPHSTE